MYQLLSGCATDTLLSAFRRYEVLGFLCRWWHESAGGGGDLQTDVDSTDGRGGRRVLHVRTSPFE